MRDAEQIRADVQVWELSGPLLSQRLNVEPDADGYVRIALDLFEQVLADLGFKRVDHE